MRVQLPVESLSSLVGIRNRHGKAVRWHSPAGRDAAFSGKKGSGQPDAAVLNQDLHKKNSPPGVAGRGIRLRQIVAFRGERGSYNKVLNRSGSGGDCSFPG